MAAIRMPSQRFIVVSGYFPPVIGGTATVIRNLLGAFEPGSFAVIAENPGSFDGAHDATVPPGIRIRRAGVPAWITRKVPYGVKISRWLRFGMIPRLTGLICREVRRAGAGCIVAVYPSWPFMIAAWLAHRRLGTPLYTYYMDVTAEASLLRWPDKPAVRRYEEAILRGARRRLVLSEAIGEDFQKRFGLDSVVIPHSIDLDTPAAAAPWPGGGEKLIVHTGVVEGLQEEGLKRIAAVVTAHPELNARLVLASPTPRERLVERGFDLSRVEIRQLSNSEVRALQRAASLLVAVLPFHAEITAYQMTAFPTKVVEYMTSGAPILAHAPRGSFFGRHVARHGYARLVDETDPAILYAAIRELLQGGAETSSLVAKARETVAEIYALPRVARRFAEACDLDPAIIRPALR